MRVVVHEGSLYFAARPMAARAHVIFVCAVGGLVERGGLRSARNPTLKKTRVSMMLAVASNPKMLHESAVGSNGKYARAPSRFQGDSQGLQSGGDDCMI